MSPTQTNLTLRNSDVYYAELIDGRYARSLKDLPGPQVPLYVDCEYGFFDWLDDLVFPSRIEEFQK